MYYPRLKPDLPKAYYHVMTRTAQQRFLLRDPFFKRKMLEVIRFYADIYYVEIMAWVIMSNHYHLVIKVLKPPCDAEDVRLRFEKAQSRLKNPGVWKAWRLEHCYQRFTDLSSFMWEINRKIAVVHNQTKGTKGHLWGSRFRSKLVEGGEHLLRVMTYVDQNPVRAGIVEKPTDFEYSSAGELFKALQVDQPIMHGPSFLNQFEGSDRVKAYLMWNDYLAKVFHGKTPSKNLDQILQLCAHTRLDLRAIEVEFNRGLPSNWRAPIYGSDGFVSGFLEARKQKRVISGTRKKQQRIRAGPARERRSMDGQV